MVVSLCAFVLTPKGYGNKDATTLAKLAYPNDPSLKQVAQQKETTLPADQQFGQFPPYTEAERELAKMLCGKDEDIDLALANWLIASDVPEFSDMTRESYFKLLTAMIDQVRQDIARMQKVAESRGQNLNALKTRCAIFCNAMIKLGFAYNEKFAQPDLNPSCSVETFFEQLFV